MTFTNANSISHPSSPLDACSELVQHGPEHFETNTPLVSVIILNYKRREELGRTLDSVVCQDYPNREIIVVDNHSEEDILSVVEARGAGIRLIELERNMGTCAGRNAGVRQARGDFIVTLDNDVPLASAFELSKIVRILQHRSDIYVLVFQICDADSGKLRLREWCHPRYWKEDSEKEFETDYLPEGASAFRREVFEIVGLYFEPFFIGGEGGDLAFRIIDRGFRIFYCPRVRVFHLMSRETRGPDRYFYFYTRNWIWTAYKDFHLVAGARFLIPKLLSMIYFTCRTGSFRYFGLGLRDGLKGLSFLRPLRTPMSKNAIRHMELLEKGRPGLVVRFGRHREQPQI
jgi:GT2 family glycosyltransferase